MKTVIIYFENKVRHEFIFNFDLLKIIGENANDNGHSVEIINMAPFALARNGYYFENLIKFISLNTGLEYNIIKKALL